MSDRSSWGVAEDAGAPFGTYFDKGVKRTGVIGCAILVALGSGAALLGFSHEVAWLDAGLATLTGLVGAIWIWSMAVRPRLEVTGRGLVVFNPVRTIEIPWAMVDSVDCHHLLTVNRSDGSSVVVAALPASGLRRIISARPGRVDHLAVQLNGYVADSVRPGAARSPVSIETPEGRRDIRVMAGLATLGVAAAAVLRHLLG